MKRIQELAALYDDVSILCGKYIYMKRTFTMGSDYDTYYLMKIRDILSLETYCEFVLETSLCYRFNVPHYNDYASMKQLKCHLYDDVTEVPITVQDELFVMNYEEFVNTYMIFRNFDGHYKEELPDKIIQDI
jgi:hypothetical protein